MLLSKHRWSMAGYDARPAPNQILLARVPEQGQLYFSAPTFHSCLGWYCPVHSKRPNRAHARLSRKLQQRLSRTPQGVNIAQNPARLWRRGLVPNRNCERQDAVCVVSQVADRDPNKNRTKRKAA